MIEDIYANNYQKLAMRTVNKDLDMFDRLQHAVYGMNSEAGEVASILQKRYQGHDIDTLELVKEMGDLLWFVAEACDTLGVSMSDVMIINIKKLKKRYPDGFEEERSLNRESDI